MPKYTVALTVHVTVDAPNERLAEQDAYENARKYLDGSRTITASRTVRLAYDARAAQSPAEKE